MRLCGFSAPSNSKIDEFNDAAGHPADGITEADGGRGIRNEACHEEEIGLTDGHEAQDHDDHGTGGIAPSPQCAGQYMVYGIEEQEEDILPEEENAEGNDGGVCGKESHGTGGEEPQDQCQGSIHDDAEDQGSDGAFIGTLQLTGTDVLGHEGGGSHGHALDEEHDELVQLVVARPAGHAGRAEAVDVSLDEDIGKGRDDGLDTGGQAYLQDHAEHLGIDAAVMKGQPVNVMCAKKQQKDQCGGDELSNDGGQSDAKDAQMEDENEDEVQDNVDDAGQYEEVQGTSGVAHGTKNTGADVVDQESGDSGKVGAEVNAGVIHDIIRCGHEAQHHGNAEYAQNGEEHAADERCCHSGFHRSMQTFHVFAAKITADDHTGTDGEAIKEKDRHVYDHGGGTHGRQGLCADIVSHHNGIHGVVQHLENVTEHQGQRKQHDFLGDVSGGHIPGGALLFYRLALLHSRPPVYCV